MDSLHTFKTNPHKDSMRYLQSGNLTFILDHESVSGTERFTESLNSFNMNRELGLCRVWATVTSEFDDSAAYAAQILIKPSFMQNGISETFIADTATAYSYGTFVVNQNNNNEQFLGNYYLPRIISFKVAAATSPTTDAAYDASSLPSIVIRIRFEQLLE